MTNDKFIVCGDNKNGALLTLGDSDRIGGGQGEALGCTWGFAGSTR